MMDSIHSTSVNLHDISPVSLRRIVTVQHREIKAKKERLSGLEDLVRINIELEQKLQSSTTRADNYESDLRRAEARIAVLNKKLGIGPQAAFDIDVVNPGISRKDFDAVSRENIQLKEALEHIVPTELGGRDVVVKNEERYEMVTKQQEDITQRNNHTRELEEASSENELALKVNDLTKRNMKLERSMNAKQVFSEKLMKENKNLMNRLESGNDMNALTAAKPNVENEERERMLQVIEEKEKMNSELSAKNQELVTENDNMSKQVQELMNELEKFNDIRTKLETELSESEKKRSDFQTKCNGFFKQVISLNRKQQDSEEEISELKQAIEGFRSHVAEKDAMIVMMRDGLKRYEADFKNENEDKKKIQKQLNELIQENEQLRREDQSHMATIRHFESEEYRGQIAQQRRISNLQENQLESSHYLFENTIQRYRSLKNQQRCNANYESPDLD